jgi:hypothetical protein
MSDDLGPATTAEFPAAMGLEGLTSGGPSRPSGTDTGAASGEPPLATAATPPATAPAPPPGPPPVDFEKVTQKLFQTLDRGVSLLTGLAPETDTDIKDCSDLVAPYLQSKATTMTGEMALLLLAIAGILSYGVAKATKYAALRAVKPKPRPDVAEGGAPGDPVGAVHEER